MWGQVCLAQAQIVKHAQQIWGPWGRHPDTGNLASHVSLGLCIEEDPPDSGAPFKKLSRDASLIVLSTHTVTVALYHQFSSPSTGVLR
jgi:hypothetical protein